MSQILKDSALSSVIAGFVAVLIAFASSAVIIFQAAQMGHLTEAQTASWIASASLGCGVITLFLSYVLKMPIITAWSTPGAALLVTALPLYSFNEAIGAYILSAVLVMIFGITGWFSKLFSKIPLEIIAAMLAGILLQFCLQAFFQLQINTALVLVMCLIYFISKVLVARYSIVLTLVGGILVMLMQGQLPISALTWSIAAPVWTSPTWSISALFGIALPLFVVAMTSQNASGLAVMKTFGYDVPESKVITSTGVMSLLTAPFGSHGITLSAITAAICTSEDCHPEKQKRYIAGLSCGVFYIIFAICAQSMVQLFAIVPKAFIIAIAGLALFTACASSLKTALAEQSYLDCAMLTFLVTASSFSVLGIGSAFWGLLAGLSLYGMTKIFSRK